MDLRVRHPRGGQPGGGDRDRRTAPHGAQRAARAAAVHAVGGDRGRVNGRPVVVTAAAAFRGRDAGRVSAWRGIRYGEPPVGALRWRAPVPAAPWTGVAE